MQLSDLEILIVASASVFLWLLIEFISYKSTNKEKRDRSGNDNI